MEETINRICTELPPGWSIELCMESETGARVNLVDPQGDYINLLDPNDKTIVEQLEDALLVAKGWRDTP